MENRGACTRPWLGLAGSLAVAGASLLVVRDLSYDAWGWLLWGREIAGRLPFTTSEYPTWKPLAALVAAPLAAFGSAGPLLWLLLARFGAVLSVVLAYRLASRAAGRAAGAIAAVSLLLVPDWLFQAGVGGSEPLLTALLLVAIDRHAARKDPAGFALVLAAALLRPEAWPLLLGSAAVTWRRHPRARPLIAAGALAVPVLWFGGDYLGSGHPFEGGHLARLSREAMLLQRGDEPAPLDVLGRAALTLPLALLPGIPVAMVEGWRRRDPIVLALGAGGLLWLAEVVCLAALGYAGVPRFLFPAAAALAVVGAVGTVSLLRQPAARPPIRIALALALVALSLPSRPRLSQARQQVARLEDRGDLEQSLDRLLARAPGGPLRGSPDLSAEGVALTPLAWHLDVLPRSLRGSRMPGLRVAMRDRRWTPFMREVRRRRLRARTIYRDGRVFLISTERQ